VDIEEREPVVAQRSKAVRIVQFGVLALAVVAVIVTFSRGSGSGQVVPASSRKPMPDFTLNDLRNQAWNLSAHRGGVVLVNFWATWCPPCREEIPGFISLSNSEPSLQVVGVALDDGGGEVVRRFAATAGITYPVLLPPASSPFFNAIQTLPTTFLIDKEGRIAREYVGAVSKGAVQRDLAILAAES